MRFSEKQFEYLRGEIRSASGQNIAAVPSTCPPHILIHVIETRARHLGIKPEVEIPAIPSGRFLRATM
jgi:hypothetical protein